MFRQISPIKFKKERYSELDMVKYLSICPRCNSHEVYPDLSKDMIAWGGSTNMKCEKCEYSSSFFPEVPVENVDKVHLKKRTKEDLKETMSTKGIHKGKPWGWFYLAGAVVTFLVAIAAGERWFIILSPFALLGLIIGIVLVWKAKD